MGFLKLDYNPVKMRRQEHSVLQRFLHTLHNLS